MQSVQWGGEQLLLLPQKAVLWPRQRALLVADVHVGKAVSFRSQGLPVPRGTTSQTFEQLDALLQAHPVAQVFFLGDFLHSSHARAPATLAAAARWRERHAALEMTLVRGNHDARAGDPPDALGIRCVDEPLHLGGLVLGHHPRPQPEACVLAGHLHPCVNVGRGFEHLRLPCFHFGARVGVLPAFGAFTGMHPVHPAEGDRVFVIADDTVRELRR